MRKFERIIYYWLPPFIWMGIIYFMSSQKSVSIAPSNPTSEFITFKTLHMVEYAFLFFLLYRAFHSLNKIKELSFVLFSFGIALMYSITDELHQLYIPTRQGRLRDVFFDLAGMLIMYGIIRKARLLRKLL